MVRKQQVCETLLLDIARENKYGLENIEYKLGVASVSKAMRVLQADGLSDMDILTRIVRCKECTTHLREYTAMRMKSHTWESFVAALIKLEDEIWKEMLGDRTEDQDEWLLDIFEKPQAQTYVVTHYKDRITNAKHSLFERFALDGHYRERVLHFIANHDDRRAWDELLLATRGLSCTAADSTKVTSKQPPSKRCYPATRSTANQLVIELFNHMVRQGLLDELTEEDARTPRLAHEPIIMKAISGELDDNGRFRYYPSAVMALKLHEYYAERKRARVQRKRQECYRRSYPKGHKPGTVTNVASITVH